MNNKNVIVFSPFESIDDFEFSLVHGREIIFEWKNIEYGVFHEGEGKESFFICESNKDEHGRYFETLDALLDCKIQGQSLKEFITQVKVWHRNL